jgi:hypothetical protein
MATILTYEQFRQILTQLGFTPVAAPGYTIYRADDHDASLVIPDVSSTEPVLPIHLIAARETILGKGIPINARLRRLLTPPISAEGSNGIVSVSKLRRARSDADVEIALVKPIDRRKRALQAKLRKERTEK